MQTADKKRPSERDTYRFCFLLVCQILPKGVVAVIGPASSPASGSTVSHICGEKEVSQFIFLVFDC